MPEPVKTRLWDITLGTLVAIALGMGGWQAKTQVAQGELLAALGSQVTALGHQVNRFEDRGTPTLQAVQKQIDADRLANETHFARLDAALMEAMKSTTELKAIGVSITYLTESQRRTEEMVRSHINQK